MPTPCIIDEQLFSSGQLDKLRDLLDERGSNTEICKRVTELLTNPNASLDPLASRVWDFMQGALLISGIDTTRQLVFGTHVDNMIHAHKDSLGEARAAALHSLYAALPAFGGAGSIMLKEKWRKMSARKRLKLIRNILSDEDIFLRKSIVGGQRARKKKSH